MKQVFLRIFRCSELHVSGPLLPPGAQDSSVKLWDLRKLKNFKTIALDNNYEVCVCVGVCVCVRLLCRILPQEAALCYLNNPVWYFLSPGEIPGV